MEEAVIRGEEMGKERKEKRTEGREKEKVLKGFGGGTKTGSGYFATHYPAQRRD